MPLAIKGVTFSPEVEKYPRTFSVDQPVVSFSSLSYAKRFNDLETPKSEIKV